MRFDKVNRLDEKIDPEAKFRCCETLTPAGGVVVRGTSVCRRSRALSSPYWMTSSSTHSFHLLSPPQSTPFLPHPAPSTLLNPLLSPLPRVLFTLTPLISPSSHFTTCTYLFLIVKLHSTPSTSTSLRSFYILLTQLHSPPPHSFPFIFSFPQHSTPPYPYPTLSRVLFLTPPFLLRPPPQAATTLFTSSSSPPTHYDSMPSSSPLLPPCPPLLHIPLLLFDPSSRYSQRTTSCRFLSIRRFILLRHLQFLALRVIKTDFFGNYSKF